MKFTFGIITTNPESENVVRVLHSIEQQHIPDDDYEVIIIGGTHPYSNKLLNIIPFDESVRAGWITRKKNIITENALYDNIVYMHDYIALNTDWYQGFLKFGSDFNVCMTPIINADGSRFRDWTLWPHDITPDGSANLNALLPYDVTDLSKFMYFSGAYWIAKKHVMQEFPLDESLSWGESEDVKFSKEVRKHFTFNLNPNSSVRLLKMKDPVFRMATPELIQQLRTNATL